MRQSISFLMVVLLSMYGCGLVTLTTTRMEASGNKDNLQKIEIGMNTNQVKEIMGAPNKTEASLLADGRKVIVWFYLTEGRGAFRSLEDWNYTPVVFENGSLTGWGYAHLDKIRKQ